MCSGVYLYHFAEFKPHLSFSIFLSLSSSSSPSTTVPLPNLAVLAQPSPIMSDLLTPSESQAFQTFLSTMDYNESNDVRNVEWTYENGAQGHHMPDIPHLQGREALAKATKDLMSLDAEGWNSAPAVHQYQQQQQHSYNFMNNQPSQYGYDHRQPGIYQQQQHSQSEFPFLSKQGSQSPHSSLNRSHSTPSHSVNNGHLPQPISISPSHTLGQDPHTGSNIRSSFSSMSSPPTTASSSQFSFASSSSHGASSSSTIPSPSSSADHSSGSPGISSTKRALDSMSYLPSNKRSRPSPPAAPSLPTKTTLLSPSQKKANHIQSEQKRRANIRRGYEALCETVPSLREAIRAEEEAQIALDGTNGNGKKPKRGRRAKIDDGTGRKSMVGQGREVRILCWERVSSRFTSVTESTANSILAIEYIKELLDDRQDLLTRLERARSSLSPDHRSGKPSDPQPLWEREWKGGSGKDGDGDEEEEEEEE
ncbi:hypothetical protein BDP27DRAFT_1326273 [Rhodocollybia butyracea]|uniref:BHLH domain-containing protein n=1 Tax=Rhodocollybia butyracea TaxID=206335 RepID=A0A9P5U8J4_9AGAR|nr:hypothetical protein BDP27DRAFT_1326273 [Rhodocollybia butyracea]